MLSEGTPDLPLDGSWERSGRSLNAAAIAGLLGIGVIYSYGQGFIVLIAMFAQGGFGGELEEGGNLYALLAHRMELSKNPIRLGLIVSQFLLMLLPTLWLVRRWHTKEVASYIRLRHLPVQSTLLGALAAAFFFPANVYLSDVFIRSLQIPDELIEIGEILFATADIPEFLLLTFALAVTPAICEEVLFRGYAQRTFERTMGWKSVLVVGMVFGLYHMQPLGLISLSGLGILFGYLYYASGSLLPGMAAHFVNNFIVVYLLYSPDGREGVSISGVSEGLVLVTLPLAAVALYGVHILGKKETGEAIPTA